MLLLKLKTSMIVIMINIISTVLIIILVSFATKKMMEASKKVPELDNKGKTILKYPKFYQVLGWICLVVVIVITIAIIQDFKSINETLMILIFPLIFVFISLYLITSSNCLLIFDEEKIDYKNNIGQKKIIYWKEIKSINFEPTVSKNLVIKDERNKISINYSIVGFTSLLDALDKKVNPTIVGEIRKKINKMH